MHFFDSHAHPHLTRFGTGANTQNALRIARKHGIRAILCAGVGPEDWEKCLEFGREFAPESARSTPCAFPAIGLHPYAVSRHPAHNRRALDELRARLDAPTQSGLVALGECGLDFRRLPALAPRALQIAALDEQLELAHAHALPVILHCVRAHGSLLERIEARGGRHSGLMLHGWSGSAEMARRFASLGAKISFAGNCTYPRARRARESAAALPLDALLIESDAPDQAPAGRPTGYPSLHYLLDTARTVAELRRCSLRSLADATLANACALLSIDPASILDPASDAPPDP